MVASAATLVGIGNVGTIFVSTQLLPSMWRVCEQMHCPFLQILFFRCTEHSLSVWQGSKNCLATAVQKCLKPYSFVKKYWYVLARHKVLSVDGINSVTHWHVFKHCAFKTEEHSSSKSQFSPSFFWYKQRLLSFDSIWLIRQAQRLLTQTP